MFLWRNKQNYPLIITKYPPNLFHFLHTQSVKTQISLGICPVWSESLLSAHWVAKVQRFLYGYTEDSDQTGQMSSLIRVFTGRTGHFVGFVMLRLFLIFINLHWGRKIIFTDRQTLMFLIESCKGKQRYIYGWPCIIYILTWLSLMGLKICVSGC